MTARQISRQGEGFEVAAELLAEGLRLPLADVPALMQRGAITSLCERGEGEDAGRWRLTFRHDGRVLRLTVDGAGELIARSAFSSPRPGRSVPKL